jgi:hypothetical protein
MEDVRYPIGKFVSKDNYSSNELQSFIQRIESFPTRLQQAIQNLTDSQLDTPYRDEGWTVRQVVHHVADSHTNAYIRLKWTLTEDAPVIKAYDEKKWAETAEVKEDISLSLAVIKSLHAKWVTLLKALSKNELNRYFIHPETKKQITLPTLMGQYAWHGDHHLAHITSLKSRMGWN